MPWTYQISVEGDLLNYSPLFPVPDGYWLCEWSCERKKENEKQRRSRRHLRNTRKHAVSDSHTPTFDSTNPVVWCHLMGHFARKICEAATHVPAFWDEEESSIPLLLSVCSCISVDQDLPMTSCTSALFSPLFQLKAKPWTFLSSKSETLRKQYSSLQLQLVSPLSFKNVWLLDLRCEPCGGIAGRAGSWTTTQLSCTKLTFCSVFSLNL